MTTGSLIVPDILLLKDHAQTEGPEVCFENQERFWVSM